MIFRSKLLQWSETRFSARTSLIQIEKKVRRLTETRVKWRSQVLKFSKNLCPEVDFAFRKINPRSAESAALSLPKLASARKEPVFEASEALEVVPDRPR